MAISQDEQECNPMLWISLNLWLPEAGNGQQQMDNSINCPVLVIPSEIPGVGHRQKTGHRAR